MWHTNSLTMIMLMLLVSLATCIEEVLVLDGQDQKALEDLNLGGVVDVDPSDDGEQQQDGISISALRPDYAIPRFVNLLQSMFDYNGQRQEKRRVREIDEPTYTHPILRTHRLFVNFGKYRG